jgi:hypothetical protein
MSYSKNYSLRFACIASILLCSFGAAAQVLRGNVSNGTTKKPGAGDDVILIKIDKAMTEEARTKSDARGEFHFELPDSQSMRAVRVVHQQVSYYQPVVPGSTSVSVTVYDVEQTVPGVHRTDETVVLQAEGGTLVVYELFGVRNDSQPPRTQPNFGFYLPDGAAVESGSAQREGGMALKSAPVPQQEKGKYLFMYPLEPGFTHYEVAYKLPYTGRFKFQPKLAGPVDKFYVVTPKSIGFIPDPSAQYQATPDVPIGSGFKDIAVRMANSTGPSTPLAFSITGDGTLQEDTSAQQQSAAGGGQQAAGEDERPGIGLAPPKQLPNPLSQGQYAFLGVLALFLAGGGALVYVTSKPGAMAVAAVPQGPSGSLLDALKEEMFQLEADRIQGKMNQQDYQSAKGALDKTLQRVMKRSK